MQRWINREEILVSEGKRILNSCQEESIEIHRNFCKLPWELIQLKKGWKLVVIT